MPPKGKSSASSATRKKQAAKAAKKAARDAGGDDADVEQAALDADASVSGSAQPKQRGQKATKKVKKDRFAPKVKKYVPPPPPPKGQPDPVDVFLVGRGKQPDPQLVVVLRRLVKKDEATLLKGCEALEGWVRETLRQEDDRDGEDWEREMRQEGVVDCMDVWVRAVEAFFVSPRSVPRGTTNPFHRTGWCLCRLRTFPDSRCTLPGACDCRCTRCTVS